MKKLFLVLLFILLGNNLWANSPNLQGKVRALVSRYDGVPSQQDWLSLGVGAEVTMIQLFNEWSEMRPWQAKILNGLRYYPTATVKQFLGDIADRNELVGLPINVHLQREAISSLVFINGQIEIPRLRRLLANRDWRVRAHVLEKLTEIGGQTAMQEVRSHLQRENNAAVKRKAEKLLKAGTAAKKTK